MTTPDPPQIVPVDRGSGHDVRIERAIESKAIQEDL